MHTLLVSNKKDPSNARMKPRALHSNVTSSASMAGVDNC